MSKRATFYVNEPPGGMKAHIFRGEDVRKANMDDETTEEPVTSVCGTVRSYGPFSDWGNGDVCQNCTSKIDAQYDD